MTTEQPWYEQPAEVRMWCNAEGYWQAEAKLPDPFPTAIAYALQSGHVTASAVEHAEAKRRITQEVEKWRQDQRHKALSQARYQRAEVFYL